MLFRVREAIRSLEAVKKSSLNSIPYFVAANISSFLSNKQKDIDCIQIPYLLSREVGFIGHFPLMEFHLCSRTRKKPSEAVCPAVGAGSGTIATGVPQRPAAFPFLSFLLNSISSY